MRRQVAGGQPSAASGRGSRDRGPGGGVTGAETENDDIMRNTEWSVTNDVTLPTVRGQLDNMTNDWRQKTGDYWTGADQDVRSLSKVYSCFMLQFILIKGNNSNCKI